LRPQDIDVDRKVIYVRNGKGSKDRITLLSEEAYNKLGEYLATNEPGEFLFEGPRSGEI
jgi:integrase